MIKKKAIVVLSLTLLFSFTISGCNNSDSYTITWKNYDGRVLEIDTDVASGTIPTYDGATPTREDDEENYFLFSGWSPEVKFTYSDQTYTAQYEVINDESYLAFILNDDNNSYSVISLSNYIPVNIEIPSTYLGKPVTSVGNGAFSLCNYLESIMIPSSITSIGDEAFSLCSSLTSINIPDGVTSIGDRAFIGCTSITSVNIPASVTNIGIYAFLNCSSLTTIDIPASVTSIGDRAFNDCSSLTSINVSDDNDNYSSIDGVFYDKNKTTLINYPCGKLETIFVIPDSVTSIGIYAFFNCTSLTTIDIPASVTSICEGAFYNCNALASIMIPDGVTSISEKAFYDCSALTTIVISDTTTSIGDSAFFRCSSLTLIVIPLSVTSIGSAAFSGCSSLTIYAEASAKPSGWKDNWNSNYRPVVWGYTG